MWCRAPTDLQDAAFAGDASWQLGFGIDDEVIALFAGVYPVLAPLNSRAAAEFQGVFVEACFRQLRLLGGGTGGAERAQPQLEVAPMTAGSGEEGMGPHAPQKVVQDMAPTASATIGRTTRRSA